VTADDAAEADGTATIDVTVPPVVKPVATKDLQPDSVAALSKAGTTVTLGVQNRPAVRRSSAN
jgi:hypothetical protein